eukprot:jgi/Picre1/29847/NNA_005229.t1
MYLVQKLLALFFALYSVAVAVRGACTGTESGEVPYSVSYTKTGDASSTTFIMQVCSTGCNSDNMICENLNSVSIAATGIAGAEGSDDCGVVKSAELTPDSGSCAVVYLDADKPDLELSDVCTEGCIVRYNMANGMSVAKTIDGRIIEPIASPVPEPVVPEPVVPEPVVPEPVVPEPVVPEVSPEPIPEPTPSPEVIISSTPPTPSVYGRRRMRQMEGPLSSRRLRRSNGARRLHQYGSS